MKMRCVAFLIATIVVGSLHSLNMPQQTPWSAPNCIGYAIDDFTGEIDDAQGFGAFDFIMQTFKPECCSNFDNGGGAYNDTTDYVKNTYNIENVVYDPFMRDAKHNERVLELARQKPFDCCTSFSILNVIDTYQSRIEHISLCFSVLKNGGIAFFKVWPGDRSGIALILSHSYQSNQNATYYLDEIKSIFGKENVFLFDDKTIRATKK